MIIEVVGGFTINTDNICVIEKVFVEVEGKIKGNIDRVEKTRVTFVGGMRLTIEASYNDVRKKLGISEGVDYQDEKRR